ncbi:MAG: uracil phosphoribosyltransferase [Elusimicrobiota bacterium]|jgi:uracil phosphoribosyltransferase
MNKVILCEHPLLQDALALMRDRNTPPARFREAMESAGVVLGLEALKDVKTLSEQVHTPLKPASVRRMAQPLVLVSILRAGLGLLPGLQRLCPAARIGHIGLYRDEKTLNPVRYYVRLPKELPESVVLLLDPMLATGGSASEAVRILKTDGAKDIRLITLLSSKTGLRRVHEEHPDVRIHTAAVDSTLNKHGYIVPGLGDAGDRLYTL